LNAFAATSPLVNPALLIAAIYGTIFAVVIWWARDDYLDFCQPVRAHVLNVLLIVAITAGTIAGTWELVLKLVDHMQSDAIGGRRMLLLIANYELLPCALLVALYGVIDLGENKLSRWPMIAGGGTVAALICAQLLWLARLN
jgi:hypothetical protein